MSLKALFGDLLDGYTPSLLIASAILLILWQRLFIKIDPREPPLLRPKVPCVGHMIGIFQHNISYFDKLFAKSVKPVVTLPMMSSKVYVITEPALAQSAFRNKHLSFEPFIVEFSRRLLGGWGETMSPLDNIPEDEKEPSFLRELIQDMHGAMMSEHLHHMNASALRQFAPHLNGIDVSQPSSFYLWLRQMVTLGTCNALLGSHSPFIGNPGLVDSVWDFDKGQIKLLLGVFPTITASKAYNARANINNALAGYYSAKYDQNPDVSQLIRCRAAAFRRYNISDAAIARSESFLMIVSTNNAIPTLFWLLCQLFSAGGTSLLEEIRQELASIVTESKTSGGKREMAVDWTKFESHCPLLVSSYRETIRLNNAQVGTRRVMKDTTISDSTTSYLLRAGCDVLIPSGIAHLSPRHWGSNAASFNARRFLVAQESTPKMQKEKDDDKAQRRAYFPFGGGKHLCPGRNFAFTEILGVAAVLLLGFEIQSSEGGKIEVPDRGRTRFTEAIGKPRSEGLLMGAKIARRQGWQDVVWKFES